MGRALPAATAVFAVAPPRPLGLQWRRRIWPSPAAASWPALSSRRCTRHAFIFSTTLLRTALLPPRAAADMTRGVFLSGAGSALCVCHAADLASAPRPARAPLRVRCKVGGTGRSKHARDGDGGLEQARFRRTLRRAAPQKTFHAGDMETLAVEPVSVLYRRGCLQYLTAALREGREPPAGPRSLAAVAAVQQHCARFAETRRT